MSPCLRSGSRAVTGQSHPRDAITAGQPTAGPFCARKSDRVPVSLAPAIGSDGQPLRGHRQRGVGEAKAVIARDEGSNGGGNVIGADRARAVSGRA